MGVITLNEEVSCKVAPHKMFHGFCIDLHNLMPTVAPHAVDSMDYHSGAPGEQGSVHQINLADDKHGKHVKFRLDAIDKENLVCKYSMIEFEGVAGDHVDFITTELKFDKASTTSAGCIIKCTNTYHMKDDTVLTKEDIKVGHDNFVGMIKLVEAHLHQNPHVYA